MAGNIQLEELGSRGAYVQLPDRGGGGGGGRGFSEDDDEDPGSSGPTADLLREEAGGGAWDDAPQANLDRFFARVYQYYQEKGFTCAITSRVLNLIALAFTAWLSLVLLLLVNWSALLSHCRVSAETSAESVVAPCPLLEDRHTGAPLYYSSPFAAEAPPLTPWRMIVILYLIAVGLFWLWSFLRLVLDMRPLMEMSRFYRRRLRICEGELQAGIAWARVVERVVESQRRRRLCVIRELTAHDIVGRIMRKENYLIAMLNKDALPLGLPGRRVLLTKTLEWNLYWCILDAMFDDNFLLRESFIHDEAGLMRRLRVMGMLNLILSPFLLASMLIYFFLRNAERFYHHPGSVGARRWSAHAEWRLREFNEVPHSFRRRLARAHPAAQHYVAQFASPFASMVASFIAFVVGALAAVLLALALAEETLLEAELLGRNLVWFGAIFGTVLAISRSLVIEEATAASEPEAALRALAIHTHHYPRRWRGNAHAPKVRAEVEAMFQYGFVMFLQELCSIVLTPYVLLFSLPRGAAGILRFVCDFTTHVDGVGHVCSLAAFQLDKHGNRRYGAPTSAPKVRRSCHGKLEKSLISFNSQYPTWDPPTEAGRQLIYNLSEFRARTEQSLHATPAASSMLYPPYAYSTLRPPVQFPHAPNTSHAFANNSPPFPWAVHGPFFQHRLAPSEAHHADVGSLMRSRLALDSHRALDFAARVDEEQQSQLLWLDEYHESVHAADVEAEARGVHITVPEGTNSQDQFSESQQRGVQSHDGHSGQSH